MKRYPLILSFAVLLTAVAAWSSTQKFYRSSNYKGETDLRVFFPGGGQPPIGITSHNIYRWNAFRWDFIIHLANIDKKDGSVTNDEKIVHAWAIDVIFDQEVNYDSKVFRAGTETSPAVTTVQVKETGNRGALVIIGEEMPTGILNMKLDKAVPSK